MNTVLFREFLARSSILAPTDEYQLNAWGWTIMVLSIGSVLSLVSFCLYRVMTLPPVEVEEHIKGPLEIDTRDTQDVD